MQIDLEHYRTEGYIFLRGVVSPQRIALLKAAIERLIQRGMRDEVTIPFIDKARGVVGRLANLLAPDKYAPAFGDWHDEQLCDIADAILGQPGRHSLFGMLASGGGKGYDTGWHRDLTPPGRLQDPAVIINCLAQPFTQFNAPIFGSDRFLLIVPGSHLRSGTAAEETNRASGGQNPMPGELLVELEPGDMVFYNPLLWHRGLNPHGETRWSMHAAFHRATTPIMRHESTQTIELNHPEHLDRFPPKCRAYIDRHIALMHGDPDDTPMMVDVAEKIVST